MKGHRAATVRICTRPCLLWGKDSCAIVQYDNLELSGVEIGKFSEVGSDDEILNSYLKTIINLQT